MEIVTHSKMVSLGLLSRDLFIAHVLDADEDGKTYDALQVVKEDTHGRIKSMPPGDGYNSLVEAFDEMKVGDKFLCIDAWIFNHKSREAKFYRKVQELCNSGFTLEEAIKPANDWLKK